MDGVLKVFEDNEFGKIRVLEIKNVPWFVGKDVCNAFGDKNHNRSLSRVEIEDKKEDFIVDSMGRNQKCILINESGLYSLLFSMQPQKTNNGVSDAYPIEVQQRIDKLKKFKHWVTAEVLPSIRKHGGYIVNQGQMSNEELLARAVELSQSIIQEKSRLLKQAEEQIELDKPKVQFAEAVSCSDTTILIRDLAKILKQNGIDIGQNRLFEYLRENGYLIKNGQSKNMPTQKSMNLELFKVKERTIIKPDNTIEIKKTIMVTGKGQIYFVNHFLGKEGE